MIRVENRWCPVPSKPTRKMKRGGALEKGDVATILVVVVFVGEGSKGSSSGPDGCRNAMVNSRASENASKSLLAPNRVGLLRIMRDSCV